MLIRNGKAFTRGLLLMASFVAVFIVFFLPVFPGQDGGGKTNGLVYADHLFNTLSKGSANFFDPGLERNDSVNKTATKAQGKSVDLDIPFKDAAQQELAANLLKENNFDVTPAEGKLHIKGELYPLFQTVLADSLLTYENKLDEVGKKHNADGRAVMKAWWQLLTSMIKPMQKAGQVDEAAVTATIISKAIEPSYNFYGISPLKVSDNIPLVAGFLIFYVVYTMWYGFAIFELFEGIGLTMKKSVAKQEV